MRRALCVGIDEYPCGNLAGAVNDAESVGKLLRTNHDGSPDFECRLLLGPLKGARNATRSSLRQHLEALFRDPAEIALFYFAGHGTVNNLDGYLVTQDAERYDEGVPMNEILRLANDSRVDEVTILLDCCHSGAFGNEPSIDNTKALLREGLSVITAGRGDQPSVEIDGGGIFTSLVLDALNGGAADVLGNVSAPAIYSYVEAALGAWDQRPLFKSHLSKIVPLRTAEPPIAREVLRRLPKLFPLPAEDRALDPSYERTSAVANPEKVVLFEELQALARVHLVKAVDCVHMYDAAMNSCACRLTDSGRYYWRLATAGRI